MEQTFEKIGPYRLVFLLGGGGMGEVWSVVDPDVGTAKALKVLRPQLGWDVRYQEMFTREARVAAQLGRHPGFPAIHHFDQFEDLPYLVMDFIDGVNLRAFTDVGTLSPGLAVHVMRSVFRSLVIAHNNRHGDTDANVVHGDLKPENVMVSSHGDIFLTDFGISRFVEGEEGAVTSAIVGTVPYMAPETFDGVIRTESDLYSAGLMLQELLTGERVNPRGCSVKSVKSRFKDGVPPLDIQVHPELENLRQALLQVRVQDRLRTAEGALEILKRVERIDRREELAERYRRLIGPPRTGMTQYLQSHSDRGSFLPGYFREQSRKRAMGFDVPTPTAPGRMLLSDELSVEPEAAGGTVALSDEALRAARDGGVVAPTNALETAVAQRLMPTPASTPVHANTDVVPPTPGDWRPRLRLLPVIAGSLLVLLLGAVLGALLMRGQPLPPVIATPQVSQSTPRKPAAPAVPELDVHKGAAAQRIEPPPNPPPPAESEPEPEQITAAPAAPLRTRRPRPALPPVDVRILPGPHPATEIKVGKSVYPVDYIARAHVPPGRLKVWWRSDTNDSWTAAGRITVPALGEGEFLFVKLGGSAPRVTRRKKSGQ